MTAARPPVTRTYGSKVSRPRSLFQLGNSSSSPAVDEDETVLHIGMKRKQPLKDILINVEPSKKKKKKSDSAKSKEKDKKKSFTQLHFCIDRSIVRSCPLCGLSYTQGAEGDEALHKTHCSRIRKGMEWGKEEERERAKADGSVVEVEEDVFLANGDRGRIIRVDGICGGKVGQKMAAYLRTINEALSAPAIENDALQASKLFLFLLRASDGLKRENIVGCVVAQRIDHAMEVAPSSDTSAVNTDATKSLVHVEGTLFCKPVLLPTPLGIARLFVSSSHRRKGIAQALLSTAARTFVHGCALNPSRGEVAFSQPTSLGRSVMEKWGNGGVRIYEEHSRRTTSSS